MLKSGAGLSPDPEGGALPTKVCVGKFVGTTSVTLGRFWDDMSTYSVAVYDKVITIGVSSFSVQ